MRTSLVKNLIQRNSKQFSGLLSIYNYGSVQQQQQQQQKND